MPAPHPLMASILTTWRTAVLPLGPCRDCGDTLALDPQHAGRCSWCHFQHERPDWVPPWRGVEVDRG